MPDAEPHVFVIPRHAVPMAASGLSPLQEMMLHAPEPVRIFSAPTGAGKSYAFQVAMRTQGSRVLFIVPTRRLAQNLAEGLLQDLVTAGIPREDALRKVFLWTSDESRRIREENPGEDVNRRRIREIRLEADHRGGIMIIATPESVARYLLKPAFSKGGADVQSIADLLRLDHVVFDEFHTIEARGMGLSMALATYLQHGLTDAKVTFLSATPVDLLTSLTHFGIERSSILSASETVVTGPEEDTPGMRAIHGDVTVTFRRDASIVAALEAHRAAVLRTLARPRESKAGQVVLILDSVRDLHSSKREIARWFDGVGVGPEDRLAINSIDDSTDMDMSGLFVAGREADPLDYRVLVATASVEMGVTFRAGLIVMNPGHDACSFVQRIGRAARGDVEGEVIVTTSKSERADPTWLKQTWSRLVAEGDVVPVDRFVDGVLAGVRKKFDVNDVELDQVDGTFRKMPQFAAWGAALFWCAMEEALAVPGHKGTKTLLRTFRPKKAAAMGIWLDQMKRIDLHAASEWRKAFLREALKLRMIAPSVKLIDRDGLTRNIPWHIWASDAKLSAQPVHLMDDGSTMVSVRGSLHEVLSDLTRDRNMRLTEEVLLPYSADRPLLEADRLFESCLSLMRKAGRDHLRAEQRQALEIGERLVRLTRIVPMAEGG